MSAEDNSSAESVDIGEALVASLGFEPTDGRKTGRKAAAADATIEIDMPPDVDVVDDGLSVVSQENETAPADADTASNNPGADSNNGTSTNGTNNSRPNTANRKKNQNRNRNRNQKQANGTGGQNNSNAADTASSQTDASSSATAEQKDAPVKNLKTAAKPTVSDGAASDASKSDGAVKSDPVKSEAAKSGEAATSASVAKSDATKQPGAAKSDGGSTGSAKSGTADDKPAKSESGAGSSFTADKKSKIATAAAAAVTGDITDAVKEAAVTDSPPPPPSAADAIKIDTPPEPAEVKPDETVPSGPPVKPSKADTSDAAAPAVDAPVADDKSSSRSEKMAAAAKATALPATETPKPTADSTVADGRIDLPDIDSSPATLKKDPAPTARVDVVKVPAAKPKSDLLAGGKPDLAQVRNIFRRKRRVQARKVRRVVRHVDPWSVLTFSVLFHLSVFAALLLASVLVWNAAEAAGTIENLETFILELGDYETFEIKGDVVFRAAVAIAGVLTLASSVMLVLLTVVFNLISDLVGGIRLTVIEEETVRVRRRKKSL